MSTPGARCPEIASPRPALGHVDLWLEWVDGRTGLDEAAASLDDEERVRAARFRFERDRTRFVARRGFLRRVLGGYLGVPPAAVRYRTSRLGRPELDPSAGVTFSTSHAAGLASVAVTAGQPVGVDVERLRPIADALDLAEQLFTRAEYEHVRALAEADRSEAFLRLWTRKESYVKAIGTGMSMSFREFEVLDDGVGLQRHEEPSGRDSFELAGPDLPAGYVGSVALSGSPADGQAVTVMELPS